MTDRRAAPRCHCGREVAPRDSDPWEGRMDDYCEDCASNRCDCYPDDCPVKYPLTPLADDWEVVVMVRATEDDATKLRDAVAEVIYGQGDLDATIGMRREVKP